MKLVILAGGRGSRLGQETDFIPKPMVKIGSYPIIWHIMKYYCQFGIKDFIICLGYKGYVIKDFFLNYKAQTNDVTISLKKDTIQFHNNTKIEDWNITLADTGISSQTGGRVKRIEKHVKGETFFLTYGDGLSNININKLYKLHKKQNKVVTVTSVIPPGRFGLLDSKNNVATKFSEHTSTKKPNVNGGFFVVEPRVFNYLKNDNTIFEQNTLIELISNKELSVYNHKGFWHPMDTTRDKEILEKLWENKKAPWKNWP